MELNGEFRETYTDDGNYMVYCGMYIEGITASIIDASRFTDGGMFIGRYDLDVITLTRLSSKHRGKGVGSELLRRLCILADKKGYTLELGVSPDLSEDSLDYEQLVTFYKKFGFEEIEELPSIMVRYIK